MREITFRAKSLHNSEWVYGGLLHQTDHYGIICDRWFIIDGTTTQDYDIGYEYEVDPNTIGQYTDWTDKNGRPIFEGDIIKNHRLNKTSFVFWNEETMTWEMALLGTKMTGINHLINTVSFGESIELELAWGDEPSYEIIGNIYDNDIKEDLNDSSRAF